MSTLEPKKVLQQVRKLKDGAAKALASSLNRTIHGVGTEATRKLTAGYHIKSSEVKSTIRITTTDASALKARMSSRSENIPLKRFKTTPSKVPKRQPKVLKAAVKRTGLKPVAGAFVGEMRNGHIGAFRRLGKRRLPIQELYGPSVPGMMGNQEVVNHVESEAERRMAQRFTHEVNRLLR
ncbi:phage tail protein [Paenibacillus sp. 481]|uniref:phage tail protein n=1 Tax=Paenibacillus sp. 481 TaxID=2835869 RepID=UPI001E592420|nr:phage tail protein [Paenibacillus sp. 481]UHA74466.1 phage tail protein [Paenibacillus sp. 481]